MSLFKKKKPEEETDEITSSAIPKAAKKKQNTATESGDYHEFIPYHGHYNPHTLITKNGELLQIIKIDANHTGVNSENIDSTHVCTREAIRNALANTLGSEDFSFWIHTLRKRRPVFHSPFPAPDFAGYLKEEWEKTCTWNYNYYNEIYISILHDGQAAPLLDQTNLQRILLPKGNRQFRNSYLEIAYPKLDALVLNIMQHLQNDYQPQRLSLVERAPQTNAKTMRQPIFYSEPLEFLGTLLNLRAEPFALPDVDLSVALQTSRLSFGFNAMEARSPDGQKRYAALLSLKHYREMPVETVDHVLQAPIELAISQSFKFIPSTQALKQYKIQKDLFEISGDTTSNEIFGVTEMLACNHKKPTDFSECQTNIAVLVDDARLLDTEMKKFQDTFAELGLITIREDLRLEECFWSQLPGNFEFIRRKDTVGTEQAGGFCRLNRFPLGTTNNNHWGPCVAMLPTGVNSPFFFNFHVQDNGHTALFDFNSFGDKAAQLVEFFLLTQTRKYNAKIICFDRNQSARLLSNKLGGHYHTLQQIIKVNRDHLINPNASHLALNPFALVDTPYNQSFLAAWCALLIESDAPPDEITHNIMRQAVATLFNQPDTSRNLTTFIAILSGLRPELAEALSVWHGKGKYAGLFDAQQESLDLSNIFTAFDMTPAITTPVYLLPLFSYLMHRVIDVIDGHPLIIVLHEAWDLLENHFFAPRLESLLEMLKQNNVMVVCTKQNPSDCKDTSTLETLMKCTATQLYIPDDIPLHYDAQGVGLSDKDDKLLENMQRQKGDFLLKQKGESITLRINIERLEDIVAIFTNDVKSLGSARGRYASVPKDY